MLCVIYMLNAQFVERRRLHIFSMLLQSDRQTTDNRQQTDRQPKSVRHSIYRHIAYIYPTECRTDSI